MYNDTSKNIENITVLIQNNSKIENFENRNNTNLDFIDAH